MMTSLIRLPFTLLFFSILLLVTLSSCRDSYPRELVQADSLLLRGDYDAVDSLLALYDKHASSHESAQHYRELLRLGRLFVKDELNDTHFSIVDSLCRYYDHSHTLEEYGKALCFLGDIYKVSGDNPSALETYTKGVQVAEDCANSYLLCWLCQEIGDVYFDQRMLDDCTDYYRKYYKIAISNRDTLRMVYGAERMGRVYTICDEVDSTIYYYNKSIELGRFIRHPEFIIPYTLNALSDIYIQLKEFDKAKAIMMRDSLNDANWAYWHLGQHNTDSALWYLEKIRGRYGVYGEWETCVNIAKLEESRGNTAEALSYYKELIALEDSITAQSQIDDTRRVKAQFNVNLVKKERDDMVHKSKVMQTILLFTLLIVFLGIIIGYYAWKYEQQKKNSELAQERLLRQEEERKNRQSAAQIERNQQQIAILSQQILEAKSNKDSVKVEKLQLEARLLNVENEQIQTIQRCREFSLKEFQQSGLYLKLKLQTAEDDCRLSEAEWQQFARYMDNIYDNFTHRLLSLVNLSNIELKVCYLIKMEVSPTLMSLLLFKSKSAITMLRQRLYKKLTGKTGTAKQLDEFILNL